MDKIQLKDKKFKLFIPQESIAKAVAQVARQIEHDIKQHEDQDVLFVCISVCLYPERSLYVCFRTDVGIE